MVGDRFVVLALARTRAAWLAAVAQWAHSGSIPVDVVKCVSGEEVRARLASSRRYSALLVDGALASVDRDLVDTAARARCPVVAVATHGAPPRELHAGMAAVLGDSFSADVLLETLRRTALTVPPADAVVHAIERAPSAGWRATVAAVCGSGGTGASTIAVALAQALADDPRHGGLVLLADLCLRADQAMLHDARELSPSLQELVEAHRRGTPGLGAIRDHTFAVPSRGYRLLLGLRRARAWPTLRRRAFEAAFDGLQQAHRVVVCDTDADVEGERETGSIDVEDRNVMARTSVTRADAVFVVASPSLKGVHSLVQVLGDLTALGVEPERIAPVFNRAPRTSRACAGLAEAVTALLPDASRFAHPVFIPERAVEGAVYDGRRLPANLGAPIARSFRDITTSVAAPSSTAAFEPVAPGSLGSWAEESEATG